MKTGKRLSTLARACGLFCVIASWSVSAQDTLRVNADSVQLRFENEQVRVLEVALEPGAREQLHSHPNYVNYVLTGGTVRNHFPDGIVTDADFKTGAVVYRDAVTHWGENVGSTTVRVILVELKTD